jgi:hypothetical protein
MDDEAFYHRYYAGTEIPREIPIRLRCLFAYQLGNPWERIRPRDKVCRVLEDLDFAELVFEAEEEFAVNVSADEMQKLDGSFDGLVRCIATKSIHHPAPRWQREI